MIRQISTTGFKPFTIPRIAGDVRDSIVVKVDSSGILPTREFEGPLDIKYPGDEFQYSRRDGDPQNLVERFLNWFFQLLLDTFGIDLPPGTSEFLEHLIYILMALLTIYMILKFFVGENLAAVFTTKNGEGTPIFLEEDQLENIDLTDLIAEALKQKDYRLAIRYHYLNALKALSRQGIIEWHHEKTNRDYQREIKLPALQLPFQHISYLYDYIWYGEQPIDESGYAAAAEKFDSLTNKMRHP